MLAKAQLAAGAPQQVAQQEPWAPTSVLEAALASGAALDFDTLVAAAAQPPSRSEERHRFALALERLIQHPDLQATSYILLAYLQQCYELDYDDAGFLAALDRLQPSTEGTGVFERIDAWHRRYRRARALLRAGRGAEAYAQYTSLSEELGATTPEDASLAGHRAYLRPLLAEEWVNALLELGSFDEAARIASRFSDVVQPLTRAQIELELDRPKRVVELLEDRLAGGELTDDAGEVARLALGAAFARLERLGESIVMLESVASEGREQSQLAQLALLELAQLHLEAGTLEACGAALGRVRPESLPVLSRARYHGTRAQLAVANRDPEAESELTALRAAYAEWLTNWRAAPLVDSGLQFMRSERRRTLLANVLDVELKVAGVPAALERALEADSCGTLARRLRLRAASVAELQGALRQVGGHVMVCVPTRWATHVFWVGSDEVLYGRGAPSGTFARVFPASWMANRAGERPDPEAVVMAAEAVTRQLLTPELRSRLDAATALRIVGLEHVTAMPPALLRCTDGTWLGVTKELCEWPSVALGLRLESAAAPALGSTVALLAPEVMGQSELDALSFTPLDRERLDRLTDEVHTGPAATLSMCTRASGGVLYIHAHGEVDPSLARPGKVMLADSGLDALAVEALFADRPAPQHVLLAACHVGRSRLGLGEDGADHLGAAFLYRGSRTCLMARGQVYHEPSKRLAWRHLSALERGLTPGAAIREARAALVAEAAHPFDFAALRLFGAAR